jgi:nucleotide-binding universal stress UspA family protein
MSLPTLLVYLPSEKAADAPLTAALKIGAAKGAHIVGLHLVPDIPVYGEFPAEVSQEVIERLEKAGRDAASAVKRVFDEHMKASSMTHEWRCFTASYPAGNDLIVQQGRLADLIVCGKPSDDAPDAWNDFAETAIMNTGRPVLLIPGTPQSTIGKHIVIAWNSTREAARAVFDALPMLKEANSVRAVTLISREGERSAAEETGAQLVAMLGRHGIRATFDVSYASGDATGEAILSMLLDEGCDLLVMGGGIATPVSAKCFSAASAGIFCATIGCRP